MTSRLSTYCVILGTWLLIICGCSGTETGNPQTSQTPSDTPDPSNSNPGFARLAFEAVSTHNWIVVDPQANQNVSDSIFAHISEARAAVISVQALGGNTCTEVNTLEPIDAPFFIGTYEDYTQQLTVELPFEQLDNLCGLRIQLGHQNPDQPEPVVSITSHLNDGLTRKIYSFDAPRIDLTSEKPFTLSASQGAPIVGIEVGDLLKTSFQVIQAIPDSTSNQVIEIKTAIKLYEPSGANPREPIVLSGQKDTVFAWTVEDFD